MLQIFDQIFEKKCVKKYSMWCLSHIYDSDYSFQCMFLMTRMSPKESMSQILTKGPNIASYLTSSFGAYPAMKSVILKQSQKLVLVVPPM